MNKLGELLASTELFEIVSCLGENPDQCIGRGLDTRLWVEFIGRLLRTEKEAIDKKVLPDNVLSISKFYFMSNTGGVMYMWKIVCADTAWLSRHFPPVEKADWARQFSVTLTPEGKLDKVSLVSTTGNANLPHPRDYGLSDSSEGVTLSE